MDFIEIKAAITVEPDGTIAGVAWPFGSADRVGDVIEKGSFAGARAPLPMLDEHHATVGVWDAVHEDDDGLQVRGRLLVEDVSRARELRALVREKAVTGLSIGFITKKAAPRRGGGRTISALDLAEVSLVAVPCHAGARITSAKAALAENQEALVADTEHREAAPDFAAIETKVADPGDTVKGIAKITDRLDKLEAKANRPGAAREEKPEAAEERAAWLSYIRKGRQASEMDLKVLTVANDVSAGYLAPPEVSREFIAELTELSPIRQYATVRQSLAPEVKYPRRLTGTNAKWEGEIEEAEESTLTFGQTRIVSHRLTTFVELSNSLIMGSDGLAEAEVRRAFAEDFAVKEGTAFVNGSGIKEPEGIMTAAGVPEVLNGHATTLNPDSLISLFYALPAPYRARAVWIMNGTTAPVIRKMKDTAGQYVWQPGLQAGEPATLLGRPVVEAPDMPEVENAAYPIAFGDLGTAYRIIDRQQLATLTDPYRRAEFAITRIYGTQWVGGGVVQPKAIRKLHMATS